MPEEQHSINDKEMEELLKRYKGKLKSELNPGQEDEKEPNLASRQYAEFKRENMPVQLSLLEKAFNFAEKVFRITPDKKTEKEMQENIAICHLNMTPAGVMSASILYPAIIAVLGIFVSFIVFSSLFFVMFFLAVAVTAMIIMQKMPEILANNWRMRASNQMVLCIFYVVTYMRHTSNLELAVNFAAEHLSAPLSIDLRKVFWNVETGKYPSIKESLDEYFESWRKWNMEFVEAFHLIESSLYETSEDRRLSLLDRSLSLILDETYEKMLHYAHNLQSPITMLHMLGVILPILGLVILPLVVTFMSEVKWYHLALLYNIILPIAVYYLGRNILSRRPTGYGDVDISVQNPKLKYYENLIVKVGSVEYSISPLFVSVLLFSACFLIGISPLLIHAFAPNFDISIGGLEFLGYRQSMDPKTPDAIVGPYGIGALILSMFIPLGMGLALGLYLYIKSKNMVKIRENAKKLEDEFASALFQLGNRVGDGLPIEIACGKVADIMKGTASGSFFELVSINIRKLGMGISQAIFDKRAGALTRFPSSMIESSMKVLIESAKKGPLVVSQSLMNVSEYIKQIHRVDERLKDLLADIISSMKSQISFLTPAISGIVIGITSMITMILGKLAIQMRQMQESGGETGLGGIGGMMGLISDGIPPYYFQLIVGIYLVEITYILIVISNGIENGADSLGEKYSIGKELPKSVILYVVISLVVTLLFNLVASKIMLTTLGA
ncbi:MAG: hypothetical protein NTZ02_04085 [Candidatus Woesearchaeota archaeon]|nr:hypothetical protein [Candidatus Woesearchaeota archaeon]